MAQNVKTESTHKETRSFPRNFQVKIMRKSSVFMISKNQRQKQQSVSKTTEGNQKRKKKAKKMENPIYHYENCITPRRKNRKILAYLNKKEFKIPRKRQINRENTVCSSLASRAI